MANNDTLFAIFSYINFTGVKFKLFFRAFIFERFCLQNSLIVGMQPQVSGKVGSLVGWFLVGPCSAFPMTVEFLPKG